MAIGLTCHIASRHTWQGRCHGPVQRLEQGRLCGGRVWLERDGGMRAGSHVRQRGRRFYIEARGEGAEVDAVALGEFGHVR